MLKNKEKYVIRFAILNLPFPYFCRFLQKSTKYTKVKKIKNPVKSIVTISKSTIYRSSLRVILYLRERYP